MHVAFTVLFLVVLFIIVFHFIVVFLFIVMSLFMDNFYNSLVRFTASKSFKIIFITGRSCEITKFIALSLSK